MNIVFLDPFKTGSHTHFIDYAHEWVQRNVKTCVCTVCGVEAPMNDLGSVQKRCNPSISPVSWLPLKLQPQADLTGEDQIADTPERQAAEDERLRIALERFVNKHNEFDDWVQTINGAALTGE